MPNHSGNDFRHARKLQTIRETTFAERRNAKPFRKWLSPSAETPNHSGNDFRRARKCQTFRETTFAKRGNSKPFKKWFAGGPQAPKPLKSELREARKQLHQLKNKRKEEKVNNKNQCRQCIRKKGCQKPNYPQEVNDIQQSSYFLLFNLFPFPTFSFFYYLCIRNYSVIINGLLIDIRTTKDLIDKNLWVSK